MMNPLQIHFHEMPSSDAIEAKIRAHVEKLETFYDRITSCRVTVEPSSRRHAHGNHFNARIDIVVPGAEIFVGRDPDQNRAHEDLYRAIDESFKDAVRQLKEYARRQRAEVKTHLDPSDPRSQKLGVLTPMACASALAGALPADAGAHTGKRVTGCDYAILALFSCLPTWKRVASVRGTLGRWG